MRNKKDWKYYLRFYFMVVAVYIVYIAILAIRDGGFDTFALISLIYLPIMFVGFIIIFDKVFDPLFRRMRGKKQIADNSFQAFIKEASVTVQEALSLSNEDIRLLRRNQKFQKGLAQAYRVQTEGETDDLNFIVLEKKFKKGTMEFNAFQVVISKVKKNIENQ